MEKDVILDFSMPIWWQCIIPTIIISALALWIPYKLDESKKRIYFNIIGVLLLLNVAAESIQFLYEGRWTPEQNLPLQLCDISAMISGIVMLRYRSKLNDLLYYWGVIGGFHSLLTPEFTDGIGGFMLPQFYILHAGILVVPIMNILHRGDVPRPKSWAWAWVYLQVLAIFLSIVNKVMGTNYFYLCEKPAVENPLLVGDWPYYIFVLEFVVVAHCLLLYLPFLRRNKSW
jgi:hypothetical integral membrane protein (TIGR02206 family)